VTLNEAILKRYMPI